MFALGVLYVVVQLIYIRSTLMSTRLRNT